MPRHLNNDFLKLPTMMTLFSWKRLIFHKAHHLYFLGLPNDISLLSQLNHNIYREKRLREIHHDGSSGHLCGC